MLYPRWKTCLQIHSWRWQADRSRCLCTPDLQYNRWIQSRDILHQIWLVCRVSYCLEKRNSGWNSPGYQDYIPPVFQCQALRLRNPTGIPGKDRSHRELQDDLWQEVPGSRARRTTRRHSSLHRPDHMIHSHSDPNTRYPLVPTLPDNQMHHIHHPYFCLLLYHTSGFHLNPNTEFLDNRMGFWAIGVDNF